MSESTENSSKPLPTAKGLGRQGAPQAPPGQQVTLTFAQTTEPQFAVVDAVPVRRRERGSLRSDARRTAEYLASRGPTPVEALHDVARMRWKDAIKQISKHAKCTELEAMKMWRDCNLAILPYAAARFDTIELGAAMGGQGGLAMSHFLAASMIADRALTGAPHPSTEGQSVDSSESRGLPLFLEAGKDGAQAPALPPKPED
jgi:hypothetical protein